MEFDKMNSRFTGKILRKHIAVAIALLLLVGVVRWNFLPDWNFRHRVWENRTTSDPAGLKGLALCPPIEDDPASAGLLDSPKLMVIQPNSPCFRCAGRAVDDGRWYNFSTGSIRLLLYSAIFDDRSGLTSASVIRIIGVADPQETWSLQCLLHHDNGVRRTPVKSDPTPIGSGWGLDKEVVQEYIFTCSAETIVPFAVSIVGDEEHEEQQQQEEELETSGEKQFTDEQMEQNEVELKEELVKGPNQRTVTSCMPVQVPVRPAKRDDFAVCVPVAHKSINPYRLIEWFELQRILGVSRVGVAHIDVNQTALDVLEHYRREGFLDLHKTDRLTLKPDKDHRRLHSTPTFNDCVLRHMHQFNWILVLDFDEFILPRRHTNLRELVQYLDTKDAARGRKPATSYVFRNSYFFLDLQPDFSISSYLTVLRHRERVPVSGRGYSVKSMINPRACSGMHNHYCWSRLEGYSTYPENVEVDVEDGLNQHYKKCHFSEEECLRMMQNVTRDDVMLRFKEELTSKVREKVKTIMGHAF